MLFILTLTLCRAVRAGSGRRGRGRGAYAGQEQGEPDDMMNDMSSSQQLRPYNAVAGSAGGQHCCLLARSKE